MIKHIYLCTDIMYKICCYSRLIQFVQKYRSDGPFWCVYAEKHNKNKSVECNSSVHRLWKIFTIDKLVPIVYSSSPQLLISFLLLFSNRSSSYCCPNVVRRYDPFSHIYTFFFFLKHDRRLHQLSINIIIIIFQLSYSKTNFSFTPSHIWHPPIYKWTHSLHWYLL